MDLRYLFSFRNTSVEDLLNLIKEQLVNYLCRRQKKVTCSKEVLAKRAHIIALGIEDSDSINTVLQECDPRLNQLNTPVFNLQTFYTKLSTLRNGSSKKHATETQQKDVLPFGMKITSFSEEYTTPERRFQKKTNPNNIWTDQLS